MTRSMMLCGLECEASTTFFPENVPISAPSAMSLAQCRLWYMRDIPTTVAPPYMMGPTTQVDLGHHSVVSSVTAAAAANAVVVWPEGRDFHCPFPNPFPNRKFQGSVTDTSG